jgi:hypothetical protein
MASLAAGRSLAVVAYAGCGHVWTRTISATGAVGPLTAIGPSPLSGRTYFGRPAVRLVADRNDDFTAAYVVPGDDIGVSHSSDGSHWKRASGLIPVASSFDELDGSISGLSTGSATWLGWDNAITDQEYAIEAIRVSDTYRPPSPPSGRGIAGPRHATLGSLGATVTGRLPVKGFSAKPEFTVRVVDALPDTVSASIGVSRTVGTTTYDYCGGSSGQVKLKPGKVKTFTVACTTSSTVIGVGPAPGGPGHHSGPPPISGLKAGDDVQLGVSGRNGALIFKTKLR